MMMPSFTGSLLRAVLTKIRAPALIGAALVTAALLVTVVTALAEPAYTVGCKTRESLDTFVNDYNASKKTFVEVIVSMPKAADGHNACMYRHFEVVTRSKTLATVTLEGRQAFVKEATVSGVWFGSTFVAQLRHTRFILDNYD